jgi:retron-type reverse transcriptase
MKKYILFKDSEKLQQHVFLYKNVIEEKNLCKVFKSLKEQHYAPGLDSYIKVNFTQQMLRSLQKLHKELKSHRYKPSPIKIVYITTSGGGKRPIGVSSVRDKIVQAAFKEELEAIYEPFFYDCSFGFRPKLSCHSALKRIKKK